MIATPEMTDPKPHAVIIHGDCLEVMRAMPEQSVDLVLGSPPYCDARTYDDGTLPAGCVISRKPGEWVDWMLEVSEAALRVSRGAVVWVAAGVTRSRNYWPAVEGLMWEWYKRGGHQYRPCYWQRHGIPGSGGDQWFKALVEYCVAFKRPGKLPFANPLAMGKPPKFKPGGSMSHRAKDGQRTGTPRTSSGKRIPQAYKPPEIANPGNVIQTQAGGGRIGDMLAHENEAPYPEKLAEWFIRSLCPEGGAVLDPFAGSGTTLKVAMVTGRKGVGIDLRSSQVELTQRRVSTPAAKSPELFE